MTKKASKIAHKIKVKEEESGQRLDTFLAALLGSRAQAARLIRDGCVEIDGELIDKPSYLTKVGQQIVVEAEPCEVKLEPAPEIELDILYEDEGVVVVNKPAGLIVHPGAGHWQVTLANALWARFSGLPGAENFRPGIVHRLDKDTSGVLICAKNEAALRFLQTEFKERRVEKIYWAVALGADLPEQGTVEAPLQVDPRNRVRMQVSGSERAKEAVTHFRVLERFPKADASLLEVRIETGRTHQIRVHLSSIGHPVAGDSEYGKPDWNSILEEKLGLSRQWLHARNLKIKLPQGETKSWEAPLSADLERILEKLRQE